MLVNTFMGGREENKNENNFLVTSVTYPWLRYNSTNSFARGKAKNLGGLNNLTKIIKILSSQVSS